MWPFNHKCSHPFESLFVEKEHMIEVVDADFEEVTYFLYCADCKSVVTLKHSKTRHGIEAFMSHFKRDE